MIKKEKATKILKQHLIKKPNAARIKKLQKLSPKVQRLGLLFLNEVKEYHQKNESYYYFQEVQKKRMEEMRAILKTANYGATIWQDEYAEVLPALFGDLSPYVQKVWDMQQELMYQTGWSRRSFRAPNNPAPFLDKRINWLINLTQELKYDFDLPKYARYCGYISGYYQQGLTQLFAAAIEVGDETGKAVEKVLLDTIYDRDEVTAISGVAIKSLLLSSNPENWKAVEQLLLSAQRQEGLRQTILECLDETNLQAQMHLMRVVLEHNLLRFSSVVRALDVWAGMNWESAKPAAIKRCMEFGLQYLQQATDIPTALKSKDNLEVYMALWASACMDIEQTVPHIEFLLKQKTIEKQMLGLLFARHIALPAVQNRLAIPYLKQDNLHLLAAAMDSIDFSTITDKANLATVLLNLWKHLPEKNFISSGKVFNWSVLSLTREEVMNKVIFLIGKEQPELLLPLFEKMALRNREQLARQLLQDQKEFTPTIRSFAFIALTDRGEWVRNNAFKAIQQMTLTAADAPKIEAILTRKSAHLRKGAIELLMKLTDVDLLESTQRLLAAKNQAQRLAGLDVLTRLHKAKRSIEQVNQLTSSYLERSKISNKEQLILANLIAKEEDVFTAENGYGVYDPAQLTLSPEPQNHLKKATWTRSFKHLFSFSESQNNAFQLDVHKIKKALNALVNLIDKNKNYEYEVTYYDGTKGQYLVGNSVQQSRSVKRDTEEQLTARQEFELLPLFKIWEQWQQEHHLTALDLRLTIYCLNYSNPHQNNIPEYLSNLHQYFCPRIAPNVKPNSYWSSIRNILQLLANLGEQELTVDFCLEVAESFFASIPKEKLNDTWTPYREPINWRDLNITSYWLNQAQNAPKKLTDSQLSHIWHLYNWLDTSAIQSKDDWKAPLYTYLLAHERHLINDHDLSKKILHSPDSLQTLTDLKQDKLPESNTPKIKAITQKCVNRLLDIELKRGDSPTVFSKSALYLKAIYGTQHLERILQALSKENLHRGYISYWNDAPSKKETLSHLLKVSYPPKEIVQKEFDTLIKSLNLKDDRLIEVAMYAPQWLPFIQTHLGWKGLTEGVWWYHAHTKETGYKAEEKWEANISTYTPLQSQELMDGAVDVDWFKTAYKQLKKTRWIVLHKAAKYISDGAGHRRAQIFSDAMLGHLKMREVTKTIKDKRRQDYVRALGLLPLNRKNPQADILKRYQLVQQFLKESKQFGAQKQTSEKLAARIGLENLARTAGYPDPIRLSWAMEAKEAQEILAKTSSVTIGETTVKLWIDEQGKAHLDIQKGNKALKSIPAKLRKDKAILAIKAAQKTLKNQYARTRLALETAMCRGDVFTKNEIEQLLAHPVVAPMLRQLVLTTQEHEETIIGYWQDGLLIVPEQDAYHLTDASEIRIAHCTDLHVSGYWSDFQRDCFTHKKVQPFKQIFRELYLPTSDELAEGTISRRYAGHQVQPKKTVALLKTRAWTADYEEGLRKVYHRENIVVNLYALADWFTPADVEAPTLETISFSKRNQYERIPFTAIPPRIFSEVMRDMDLVVSVAHVGGVDPEASHSTIEMRSVMAAETALLLQFDNVKVQKNHLLITGELGDYSIHLGSGVVHKMPGGYLSILPVHSQHRGRIFLPFADDDPKTAEILSKMLLLAEDGKVKDPTVLRQL